jgi:hypothetical protein
MPTSVSTSRACHPSGAAGCAGRIGVRSRRGAGPTIRSLPGSGKLTSRLTPCVTAHASPLASCGAARMCAPIPFAVKRLTQVVAGNRARRSPTDPRPRHPRGRQPSKVRRTTAQRETATCLRRDTAARVDVTPGTLVGRLLQPGLPPIGQHVRHLQECCSLRQRRTDQLPCPSPVRIRWSSASIIANAARWPVPKSFCGCGCMSGVGCSPAQRTSIPVIACPTWS